MTGKLQALVVAQQNSQAQIVGWQFIPFGVSLPQNAKVKIYRAEVANGPFDLIASVKAERGWYYDDTVDLLDRWTTVFYKLELVLDDGTTTEYDPIFLNHATDAMSRNMVKHMNAYLRLSGIPVLVYQYIDSGERCASCWDPVLHKTTQADCPDCLGTGFLNGYHAPVLTLAALGVEGKQNIVNERVEQEVTIEMLLSNFPILRPGDIIYELDAGKRYRVQQVLPVEKHRMLVNQSALGYALNTTDVEHELPIPALSEIDPILKRKYSPHRQVSSTKGGDFDNQPFDTIKY